METTHKKQLLNNLTHKTLALIIGYGLWTIMSGGRAIEFTYAVPVCFYNQHDTMTIDAPETITIQLYGRRADVRSLDLNNLALHIDAQALREGDNLLTIQNGSFFLPPRIKLLHYAPAPLNVHVKHNAANQGTSEQ